jgi:hypothetical protein
MRRWWPVIWRFVLGTVVLCVPWGFVGPMLEARGHSPDIVATWGFAYGLIIGIVVMIWAMGYHRWDLE